MVSSNIWYQLYWMVTIDLLMTRILNHYLLSLVCMNHLLRTLPVYWVLGRHHIFLSIFSSNNWITDELLEEINMCLSSPSDIDRANDKNRFPNTFRCALLYLVPQKRILASHIQLNQVMEKFAESWAFYTTNSAKSIQCHFSRPIYKSRGNEDSDRCSRKNTNWISV